MLFPAWLLGRDPRKKVIGASYSLGLAAKLHNDWLRTTALSRLDDKRTGAIVVCCQRLHVGDLPDQLREVEGWEILSLLAITLVDQLVDLGDGRSYLFRAGDLLHREREPRGVLDELRRDLGINTFSAQYLQQPVPVDGTLIKWDWFRRYEKPPFAPGQRIVQSWDIATSTGDNADWSVGTTWCVDGADYYLIDVARGRWSFPEVLRKVRELAIQYRSGTILIEEAGTGLGFIQQYNAGVCSGQARAIGVRPKGDKVSRLIAESPIIEAGHVLLPNHAPWLDDLRRELTEFPNGRHDDQVDAAASAFNVLAANSGPARWLATMEEAARQRREAQQ